MNCEDEKWTPIELEMANSSGLPLEKTREMLEEVLKAFKDDIHGTEFEFLIYAVLKTEDF